MWTDVICETYRYHSNHYQSALMCTEWAMAPPPPAGYVPLTAYLWEAFNLCLHSEKTGCLWRDLPTDLGSWWTARTWYDRLHANELWAEIAALLTRVVRPSPRP
ncbi:transposase [Methylorubrum extorquens]